MIIAIGKRKTKIVKDEVTGEFKEKIMCKLNYSADHRHFDGGYGSKMNIRFSELIESLDRDTFFVSKM